MDVGYKYSIPFIGNHINFTHADKYILDSLLMILEIQ